MSVTDEIRELSHEMRRLSLKLKSELEEKEGKYDLKWKEYTSGHLVRTAEYAVGIAKTLEVNPETTELIWLGANLHDAGKLYVDNELLLSDRKFSEAEKVEIRKHPEYGVKWLKDNTDIGKVPKTITDIILHHHEDWNDHGYPNGLKMQDVPYVARIVRVADSWDAITAGRPYMKGMSQEDAAKDMEKRAGIKYEPKIVEALLKAVGARK